MARKMIDHYFPGQFLLTALDSGGHLRHGFFKIGTQSIAHAIGQM